MRGSAGGAGGTTREGIPGGASAGAAFAGSYLRGGKGGAPGAVAAAICTQSERALAYHVKRAPIARRTAHAGAAISAQHPEKVAQRYTG